MPTDRPSHRRADLLLPVLFALGVVLRLVPYLANRSLWLDEAMLALNVLERPFAGLWHRLDNDQAAPPLFLWLVKGATVAFGEGERALRLVPLLGGLLALIATWALARRLLGARVACVALGLVAWSDPLVYYSVEAKPYATDAAAAALLPWLALRWLDEPTRRRAATLLIAGALLPWLSLPAVFSLLAVSLLCFLERRGRRFIVPWGLSVSLFAWWTSRTLGGRGYFAEFWARGYPPSMGAAREFGEWCVRATAAPLDLLVGAMRFGPAGVPALVECASLATAAVLASVGLIRLLRRSAEPSGGRALLLLGGPICAALLAAALHLYPFAGRLLLFASPLLAALVAAGAVHVFDACRSARSRSASVPRSLGISVVVLAALPLLAVPAARALSRLGAPLEREALRPLLGAMAERRTPGQGVWVYYAAAPAMRYYLRREVVRPERVVFGVRSRGDATPSLREVSALLDSGPVWVVAAHGFVNPSAAAGRDTVRTEVTDLIEKLDLVARRVQDFSADDAVVALYTK